MWPNDRRPSAHEVDYKNFAFPIIINTQYYSFEVDFKTRTNRDRWHLYDTHLCKL